MRTFSGGSDYDAYAYDALGRMLTAQRSATFSSTVTFTHDSLGRLLSEAVNYGAQTKTVSYTYDQADRRTSMTLPGGEVVAYGYEDDPNYFDGRVRSIYADDANHPIPTVYYTYTGPAVTQRSVELPDAPGAVRVVSRGGPT